MDYYVGNAVYNYLIGNNMQHNFFWMSADKWLLVYGDEHHNPKVVSVVSQGNISEELTTNEKNALKVVKNIVKNTDVGMNFIKYDPNRALSEVKYWEIGEERPITINMGQLKNRFLSYGLKMNSITTNKEINDKSSSTYHKWQRENMGSYITVTDIDLIRFNDNKVGEFIELKRSKDDIRKWQPYKNDYNNFILLSRLAKKANIDFYIVYNYRRKNPFYDDISKLKLFEFDHRLKTYCRFMGYGKIEDFAKKERSIDMVQENNGGSV